MDPPCRIMEKSDALPGMKIDDLDDDCLEAIYKKLEFQDKVRFMLVCQRFCSIFEMSCKRQHNLVRLENNFIGLTPTEISEFFRVAGPSIKTISGEMMPQYRERVAMCIGEFCTNVTSIQLKSSHLESSCLRKFFEKTKSITDLRLDDCLLNDDDVLAIEQMPRLAILSLSRNEKLTGKHLQKLTNLRELDLQNCANIEPTDFMEVLKSVKELNTLNIQRCDRLSSNVFAAMQEHCPKLESLKMSCLDIPYDHIARLPALKRFEIIAGSGTVQPGLFTALSQHMSDQLEYLKVMSQNCITHESAERIASLSKLKQLICPSNEDLNDICLLKFCKLNHLEKIVLRNCPNITNESLLSLVNYCPKLQCVNVQHCRNITDQFVFDVIELLRRRKRIEEGERFLMGRLQHDKYKNTSSLLNLSFVPAPQLCMSEKRVENRADIFNIYGNGWNEAFDDDYEEFDEFDDFLDVDENLEEHDFLEVFDEEREEHDILEVFDEEREEHDILEVFEGELEEHDILEVFEGELEEHDFLDVYDEEREYNSFDNLYIGGAFDEVYYDY